MTDDDAVPEDAPPDARRTRPTTENSYGVPDDDDEDDLLPWSHVTERLATDRTFWLSTTRPDGRPHARPAWGVWVGGTLYCGGGERTRWVRNLAADPRLTVHTESGEDVVILEGTAERIDAETAGASLARTVDDAYEVKYGIRHGTPFFAVRPETVLAWRDFPTDATKWAFEG
jgi:nitroimidazol reductase NimA-like FMN-containing flavoprotein (pyridoxamine 5'-phosphate oxidase superfamily)